MPQNLENSIFVPETISTNLLLREVLQTNSLPEFFTVHTDYQTAGRGQKGNSWEAANAENLLFSVVLYPHFILIEKQFILSQIVSLAIKDTLEQFIGEVTIKWPNDIYWQNEKICGILIENALSSQGIDYTIVGIGINVNQRKFESNAPNPISMHQISGINYNREEILGIFLTKLQQLYREIQAHGTATLVNRYKQALYHGQGLHSYQDSESVFEAFIEDITDTGYLVLRNTNNTLLSYAFKEVKFLINKF